MKNLITLIFCLVMVPSVTNGQTKAPQPIKDPLYAYCKDILNDDNITKIYAFEGKFTDQGGNTIFITNDKCRLGSSGFHWSIYYPQGTSGCYLESGDDIQCGILGPDYIGYVAEFKRYGILNAGRNGITFQYLDHGTIKNGSLGGNGTVSGGKGFEDLRGYDESTNAYPNYFNNSNRVQVTQYTLSQLRAKYGSQ